MEGLEVHRRSRTLSNAGLASFVPDSPRAIAVQGPSAADQEHVSKYQSCHVPCGLSPLVFAIIVALLTMLVVGAAVGGGLGASLAAARQCTSPSACPSPPPPPPSPTAASASSPAISLTHYTVADPSLVTSLALDCPHRHNEKYETVHLQVYTISCWQQYIDYDLASIVAYTLNACIEACSSMNNFAQQRNGTTPLCSAVSFQTNLSDNLSQYANCWLKYGTPKMTGNRKLAATAKLDTTPGV